MIYLIKKEARHISFVLERNQFLVEHLEGASKPEYKAPPPEHLLVLDITFLDHQGPKSSDEVSHSL